MVLSQVRRMEISGIVCDVVSASSKRVSEMAIVLISREIKRSRLVLNGFKFLALDIKG